MLQSPFIPMARRRHRRRHPAWAIALAVIALCLRLVLPAPLLPATADDLAFTSALGEHALCLAAAAADLAAAPAPLDRPATPTGDHGDHHGLGCCSWHAGAGFILPRVAAIAVAAYETIAFAPGKSGAEPLVRIAGPGQARAPPLES